MVEDHLRAWLCSRLTLAERCNLERRDHEADHHPMPDGNPSGRCSFCCGRLKPDDLSDPLTRCVTCRKARRGEQRRWKKRPKG
jgi:hypothetical protein